MPAPIQTLLTPQYITLADITSRIGDKVIISDDAVPTELANELIAFAEADTETDLQIRFLTPFQTAVGSLSSYVTINGVPGGLQNASATTASFLKKLFVARSIMYILRNFFGRAGSGNVQGGDFYESAELEYNILLTRVLKKLPNRLYAFQMLQDLLPNPTGINAVPKGGSVASAFELYDLSLPDYAVDNAILDPQINYQGFPNCGCP